MPLIRRSLDAEESHRLAVRALGMSGWLRPRDVGTDGPELKTEVSEPCALQIMIGFDCPLLTAIRSLDSSWTTRSA